jgi:uncharacterized protein (TIGR03083 family)
MRFPAEDELRRERARFMATLTGLGDADFASGRTLCAGWAPRDVLAHVISTDQAGTFVRKGLWIAKANAAVVAASRSRSRAELTEAGHRWAARPSPFARLSAAFLLGDVAVHHQDVLRGLGKTRELPDAVAAAVFREGLVLGGTTRLLHHRVVPTTPGARALGRGREVRGTTEALGMWLAGRDTVADLEFAPA